MNARRRFACFALVLALAPAPASAANDVLMIGDSWGGAACCWNDVFAANGHPEITLQSIALAGTKASDWAAAPGPMQAALAADPELRWMIVSLGGNDMFADWTNNQQSGWEQRLLPRYRAILDAAIAARPEIRVLFLGYDFMNFEQNAFCVALAFNTFHGLLTPQINAEALKVSGAQAAIDAEYSSAWAVGVWGALQAAGGISPAPNLLLPSPAQYFVDCIHPNEAGYAVFNQAVYDAYFAAQLAGCATDADADGFVAAACGGVDCDDGNAAVHPGAAEVTGNGLDDDCTTATPDDPPPPPPGCSAVAGAEPGAAAAVALYALAGLAVASRRRRD